MAGRSARSNNWAPNSPATRYEASGKNREFYTFENAPGLGSYASGGTIIDGGDGYIYHIFTGDGTFAVNRPPAAIDSVDYLIVAGGGAVAPGPAAASGGGGGGGFVFGTTSVTQSPFPIVVGAGGPSTANVPTTSGTQRNGSPSSAFGLVATGGGSGGNAAPGSNGLPGGSGGAGAFPGGTGGTGNFPSLIPRQGYQGASPSGAASGGGGAGGIGRAGGPALSQVGAGGSGRVNSEFPLGIVGQAIPSPIYSDWSAALNNFGGFAAGGCGTDPVGSIPAPLTRTNPANSGFGGQGASANAGGSGIVCIRYRKGVTYQRATGGTIEPNTHPEHPGVWRHIFTGPGTFEVTDPTLQWIDYLAVGGGGGGGAGAPPPFNIGGGGGGGGFVSSIYTSPTTPTVVGDAYPWNPGYAVRVGEQMPVGIGTYPVVIGAGGASATNGENTTIGSPGASQIIANGGGYGGTAPQIGGPGGSGGGGAKIAPSTTTVRGGDAIPLFTQGNPGGSTPVTPLSSQGAGGGGAGGGGINTGSGGNGWHSVLSPSAYGTPGPLTPTPQYRYFAGGGGGYSPPLGYGVGGAGGGGTNAGAGTTNTGGGGGGNAGTGPGGSGGPGIVIIQYPE